jgi:hypothetical protein
MSIYQPSSTATVLRLRALAEARHYSQFVQLFVESETQAGELVIRDNLPAIDAMRAGVLLGLKFTVKELEGVKRLTASKAA